MSEADIVAKMPGLLVVKDANLKFIAITPAVAKLCGWESPKDGIGRIDHDMPSKVSECALDFLRIDQLAISSSSVNKVQAIHILCYETGWTVLLTERQAVKMEDGSEKLYIPTIDITNQHLVKGMFLMDKLYNNKFDSKNKQKNYIINYNHLSFALTEKQELCLFLILRGKTIKEIADILHISTRTVEEHINMLKNKLNCYSKSQLIEKAIDSGLLYCLPGSFLKRLDELGLD